MGFIKFVVAPPPPPRFVIKFQENFSVCCLLIWHETLSSGP